MAKDKKLAEAAYQFLKEELIFGKLLPGDKLLATLPPLYAWEGALIAAAPAAAEV